MMESDLPLIEMTSEDDSLLQQLPDLDKSISNNVNIKNNSLFTFSPLQLSNTKSLKDSTDMSKPSCSTPRGSRNKENINMNKLEGPKLNIEPLQMKRRKKGGGYNLRKSLAWDRAFFTDEGVLDPLELSMISGTLGNSCGDPLPVINEEGNKSFSADSNCTNDSEDLQAIEETLFKELPDRSNKLKEDREKAGSLVQKHGQLAHDNATRKVLSACGGNKMGSKGGGCPRPLASYSLKRPATANTIKAARKESKLPKTPVSKPGSCFLPTTTRSTVPSVNPLRHNQIVKSAVNVQKNVGMKSSSKNVKAAQTKAKTGSDCLPVPAKDPAQQTSRNPINSSSEAASSAKSRPLQVSKANNGLEMIADRLHPCEDQERSAALAFSLPQNPCTTSIQSSKIQPAKPSGLRLPSPSLGFFGQTKASDSDSLSRKNSGTYSSNQDSTLPGMRKFDELMPPLVPGRKPVRINDITESSSSAVLSSSKQCSAPSALTAVPDRTQPSLCPTYTGVITSAVLDRISKSDIERSNVQKVDMEVPYECSEPVNGEHETRGIIKAEQKIHQHAEHIEREKMVWKEDAEMKMSNDQVLYKSTEQSVEDIGACILSAGNMGYKRTGVGNPQVTSQDNNTMLSTVVPGTDGTTEQQDKEDKLQNYSVTNHVVISKSPCGESIQHIEQTFQKVRDDMRCILDLDQLSGEQVDMEKFCTCEDDPRSHVDGHFLDIKDRVSKVFEKCQKDEAGIKRDVDIKAPTGSEQENCYVPFRCDSTYQENDDANVGDDRVSNVDSHCLKANDQASKVFGEHLKDETVKGGDADTRSPSCYVSKLENFHVPFRYEDKEQENDFANRIDVFSNTSPVADARPLSPHESQSAEDCNSNPSTSEEHKNSFDFCELSDRFAKCLETKNLCLAVEPTSQSNAERQSDVCIVLVESSCSEKPQCEEAIESVQCSNIVVPGQAEDGGVNVDLMSEQPHVQSMVGLVEVATLVGDHKHSSHTCTRLNVELINEAISLDGDASLSPKAGLPVQCANILSNGSNIKNMEVDGLNSAVVVSEAECKIYKENFCRRNQRMVISVVSLLEKSIVAEESRDSLGDIADGSPTIQGGTDGLETSYSQFHNADQTNEEACGVGNIINSCVEDAQEELLDEDILVRSCSRHMSIVHDQSLKFVGPSEKLGEQPELSSVDLEVELVSKNSHQLLLQDESLYNRFTDSEEILHKNVWNNDINVIEQSDVHHCDQKISNAIAHAQPAVQENGSEFGENDLPSVEHATSGSPEIKSAEKNHKCFTDWQLGHGIECSDQSFATKLDSDLERSKDQTVGVSTTCSASEESCSLLREITESIELGKKPELSHSCFNVGQVIADNRQLFLKDNSSHKKITEVEDSQHDNALDRVTVVPEQNIIYGCDPESSNVSAQVPPTVQENDIELDEDDQPNFEDTPQGSARISPSAKNDEYFTDRQFRHDMESSGHAIASEFDLELMVNQVVLPDVKTTCAEVCAVKEESCSPVTGDKNLSRSSELRIGVDGSKRIVRDKAETKIPRDSNGSMVGEYSVSGLEKIKDATTTTSNKTSDSNTREDNSLMKHLPNAVPFSDEWLAAIEAAGEDILTMKRGAVQNSPPDKSLPEPSPWSPVKRKANQIGPFDCTKYTNTQPTDSQ